MKALAWTLLAALALGGCWREAPKAEPKAGEAHHEEGHAHEGEAGHGADEADQSHEGEAGHGEAEHDHGGSGVEAIHIPPDLLRDLRLTVRAAERRPVGESVMALGELRVNEEAYAEVASPIEARVRAWAVKAGDRVRAGQVVAELDSREVGQARAAHARALARQRRSAAAVARRRDLVRDESVSVEALQSSEAELAEATADARAALADLAALGAGQGLAGRFVLRAPRGGVVLERNGAVGGVVGPEKPLVTLAELGQLWLVAQVFERDASRLSLGATAKLNFPALPGESFSGRVTWTASRVDPSSRTMATRIVVPNPQGLLRPGMSGTAHLPVGLPTERVVTVASTAMQRVPELGWCVFLPLPESGAFSVRQVGRGRELGGEVEVLRGLKAGERVVVDGAFLLRAEAEKAQGGGEEHHHH